MKVSMQREFDAFNVKKTALQDLLYLHMMKEDLKGS